MGAWMDGWMGAWMDGWMRDAWMNGRINGRANGWMGAWMDTRMDGWMDGWTDVWMQRQTDMCCRQAQHGSEHTLGGTQEDAWLHVWQCRKQPYAQEGPLAEEDRRGKASTSATKVKNRRSRQGHQTRLSMRKKHRWQVMAGGLQGSRWGLGVGQSRVTNEPMD